VAVSSSHVTAGDHGGFLAGALHDEDALDGRAAAGQRLVGDGLEGQRLAATVLAVGGDQQDRAGIVDAVSQRLGGETAKHDGVGGTDTGTGLHRDDALDGHRQVDDDAVTLLDALALQRVGKLADAIEEILVGDLGNVALVTFEDQRDLVAEALVDLTIETVVRNVQLAIGKPLEERCIALVENLGEGRLPIDQLLRPLAPETFVILICFGAEGLVRFHARHGSVLHHLFRRIVELLGGFVRHFSPLLVFYECATFES
jgi:hypothetical protein